MHKSIEQKSSERREREGERDRETESEREKEKESQRERERERYKVRANVTHTLCNQRLFSVREHERITLISTMCIHRYIGVGISIVCLAIVILLHVLATRPGTWQLQKRALMHLATMYVAYESYRLFF